MHIGSDFRKLIVSEQDVINSLDESVIESIFDYKYYTRHIDASFKRLGIESD